MDMVTSQLEMLRKQQEHLERLIEDGAKSPAVAAVNLPLTSGELLVHDRMVNARRAHLQQLQQLLLSQSATLPAAETTASKPLARPAPPMPPALARLVEDTRAAGPLSPGSSLRVVASSGLYTSGCELSSVARGEWSKLNGSAAAGASAASLVDVGPKAAPPMPTVVASAVRARKDAATAAASPADSGAKPPPAMPDAVAHAFAASRERRTFREAWPNESYVRGLYTSDERRQHAAAAGLYGCALANEDGERLLGELAELERRLEELFPPDARAMAGAAAEAAPQSDQSPTSAAEAATLATPPPLVAAAIAAAKGAESATREPPQPPEPVQAMLEARAKARGTGTPNGDGGLTSWEAQEVLLLRAMVAAAAESSPLCRALTCEAPTRAERSTTEMLAQVSRELDAMWAL